MSNWAKDYLKYSNETGGGSSGGGPVGNNGPGCAGRMCRDFGLYSFIPADRRPSDEDVKMSPFRRPTLYPIEIYFNMPLAR